MPDDPRRAAADYLAALDEREFASFVREARDPERTRQLTKADLKGMTPDAIIQAQAEGRLDALLGVPAEQTELIAKAGRLEPITGAELRELNQLGRYDLVSAYAAHIDRVTH